MKYHWIRAMQDTGHPGKTIGTLQVVSLLVFLPENHPNAFCAPVCTPMTSLPQKQCHLVVGHTLMHTLSKFEANGTDSS